LLRRLLQGESLELPHSRPMPTVAPRCHELRVNDKGAQWRIIYRVDADAIVILEVFGKKDAHDAAANHRDLPETVAAI